MAKSIEVYSIGPCCASVCTELPPKVAERWLNKNCPTGIDSPWKLSKDKTFKDGEPMPDALCM